MVLSELDELIELYESEKNSLENFIKEAVTEWEYLSARYHSLALRKVNKNLLTLYNLKDPLYEARTRLLSGKSMYENMLRDEKVAAIKTHYEKELNRILEQIDELNDKKATPGIGGQQLDDAIYDLVEGKTSGFKFHLSKSANFYLYFKNGEHHSLLISLTPGNLLTEDYFIESHLKALTGLGFNFNPEEDCLEYRYDLKFFKNSISIKTFVSRIIFDVYYYKMFDEPASIEFDVSL